MTKIYVLVGDALSIIVRGSGCVVIVDIKLILRGLLFESTRAGASDVWTYDLSSKAFTRITRMPGGARMPVWAPAGGAR